MKQSHLYFNRQLAKHANSLNIFYIKCCHNTNKVYDYNILIPSLFLIQIKKKTTMI